MGVKDNGKGCQSSLSTQFLPINGNIRRKWAEIMISSRKFFCRLHYEVMPHFVLERELSFPFSSAENSSED